MKIRISLLALSVVFGLSGCVSSAVNETAHTAKSALKAHWGYTGHNTPDT